VSGSSLKQIKRFLTRLMLISLIIFLCDLGIGKGLKFFYFRQSSGALYRTTYAIDSTKAEILVFGSSRANHHYVPGIFEDSLHHTFYNTGRDGNFTLYNCAIFESIISRYQPKMIIMDINPEELGYEIKSYERLSSLLPYYEDHKEIRKIVASRSPFEKIKLFSAIYPYNSTLLTIAMGNFEFNKKRKPDIKGYVPIFKKMNSHKWDTIRIEKATTDEKKAEALKQMITSCKQRKIDLYFVQSPNYNITLKNDFNDFILELCKTNDITYLNFSNDSEFANNPQYFADRIHLNDEGARIFSNLVIKQIKGNLPPYRQAMVGP